MAQRSNIGGWFLAALVAAIWFVGALDSKFRYQVQYSTNSEMVILGKEPADCDFFRAPLGEKDCHYEKAVLVTIYALDPQTGRPVVSYDERKSWQWNDGGPKEGTRVYVTWHKVTP